MSSSTIAAVPQARIWSYLTPLYPGLWHASSSSCDYLRIPLPYCRSNHVHLSIFSRNFAHVEMLESFVAVSVGDRGGSYLCEGLGPETVEGTFTLRH